MHSFAGLDSPLRQLALTILAIPSSSAGAERMFSTMGILLNARRNRLSEKAVQVLSRAMMGRLQAETVFQMNAKFVK